MYTLNSNCYCKLISHVDDRLTAWNLSRPNLEDASIDEIDKLPLSFQNLEKFTFSVGFPRIMLELISQVTKDIWSQTSRITPIKDVQLALYSTSASELLTKAQSQDESVPQDKARMMLPVFSFIEFTFSMSKLGLISFLKSLKQLQPELYDAVSPLIINASGVNPDEYEWRGVINDSDRDLMSSEYMKSTEAIIDTVGTESYGMLGQLQRHFGVNIVSELWWTPIYELANMTMGSSIKYHMTVPKDIYLKNILSHRTCWIADWNLWSQAIDNTNIPLDKVIKLIPCQCDKSKCKFAEDMKGRLNGTDPNLPCPLYTGEWKYLTERIKKEGRNTLTDAYSSLCK